MPKVCPFTAVATGRTVLEVLQDFSSARLPLEWLVQACPRLQPRQFSIACSQAAHPHEAHITLAVVDYRTPFRRRKRGLCSTWLAGLQPGEPTLARAAHLVHHPKFSECLSTHFGYVVNRGGMAPGAQVPVWVDKGVLHLPADPSRPLIMVGPGTGVAPFRAFLEEREVQQASGKSSSLNDRIFASAKVPQSGGVDKTFMMGLSKPRTSGCGQRLARIEHQGDHAPRRLHASQLVIWIT